ncbi:MAG: GAF domain-containing protein [Nitrospinota bacterium]|nr:GAF domain-containing protein [Nitrospinota bacterium]
MKNSSAFASILEILGETGDPRSASSILPSVLKKLLSSTNMKTGLIRLEHVTGDLDISMDISEKLPTFCFTGLDAPGCVCGESINSGLCSASDKFEEQFCNQAGFGTVISIPVRVGEKPAGFIFLAGDESRSDIDMEELMLVAKHVGMAVRRIEKFYETEKRLKTLETVSHIGTIITSHLDLKELTRAVVDHLGKVIKNDRVNLVLYNQKDETLEFIASFMSGEMDTKNSEIYPLSDGMNSWIVKNRRPLLMKENTVEECKKMGIRHGGKPARSWLGVPILHRGMILGVLSVQSYNEPFLYNNASIELLNMVATQVAVAIENTRLYETTAKREIEKQSLYYSLTHDLLSLVTPISGFSEVMLRMDENEFKSKHVEIGNSLKQSASRIIQFVEDILTFSKIQSGKLELHPENANLYQIIDHSVSNFHSELNLRKLDLYIEGEKVMQASSRFPKKVVTCDTLQIERVLNNCLQNAVKHASSRVELKTSVNNKKLFCTISDDGNGMSRDLSHKIFDEYFQASNGKSGVGLGLPSVKRIVELHGGKVEVETDIGKGFAFTFSLPVNNG